MKIVRIECTKWLCQPENLKTLSDALQFKHHLGQGYTLPELTSWVVSHIIWLICIIRIRHILRYTYKASIAQPWWSILCTVAYCILVRHTRLLLVTYIEMLWYCFLRIVEVLCNWDIPIVTVNKISTHFLKKGLLNCLCCTVFTFNDYRNNSMAQATTQINIRPTHTSLHMFCEWGGMHTGIQAFSTKV